MVQITAHYTAMDTTFGPNGPASQILYADLGSVQDLVV